MDSPTNTTEESNMTKPRWFIKPLTPQKDTPKKTPQKKKTIVDEAGLEYNSLSAVLEEVFDVGVFDLAMYSTHCAVGLLNDLIPEPPGVYVQGRLEPIVQFSPETPLFSASAYRSNADSDIVNYTTFTQCRESILSVNGKVICKPPVLLSKLFSSQCSYHYGAIYACLIGVAELLSNLHRGTETISPISTLGLQRLDLKNYVHSDVDPNDVVLDRDPGVLKLRNAVLDFVGRDVSAIYTLRLKNTTLYVEKGYVYRIVEYYRQLFAKMYRDDDLAEA